jgi:hypothetical protein
MTERADGEAIRMKDNGAREKKRLTLERGKQYDFTRRKEDPEIGRAHV